MFREELLTEYKLRVGEAYRQRTSKSRQVIEKGSTYCPRVIIGALFGMCPIYGHD